MGFAVCLLTAPFLNGSHVAFGIFYFFFDFFVSFFFLLSLSLSFCLTLPSSSDHFLLPPSNNRNTKERPMEWGYRHTSTCNLFPIQLQ